MKFSSFLKLVEIQTKVASVLPFLVGTLVSLYYFKAFNSLNALIMFGALLCIDMATTAINNYTDYQKAIHTTGYGYSEHNAIVRDQLNVQMVQLTIIGLITMGGILGLWLFVRTDWVVLLVGMLAFGIGITYTFGPVPISRTPFGEAISGLTMGFGIPFLAVYSHQYAQGWIQLSIRGDWLQGQLNLLVLLKLFLISVPLVMGISNIMLANNICDMAEDWENHRYTLPLSIGKGASLKLYVICLAMAYSAIVIGVCLGWLPLATLLTLLTLPLTYKLSKTFVSQPVKSKTFINAVKTFILIGVSYSFSWMVALVLK